LPYGTNKKGYYEAKFANLGALMRDLGVWVQYRQKRRVAVHFRGGFDALDAYLKREFREVLKKEFLDAVKRTGRWYFP